MAQHFGQDELVKQPEFRSKINKVVVKSVGHVRTIPTGGISMLLKLQQHMRHSGGGMGVSIFGGFHQFQQLQRLDNVSVLTLRRKITSDFV